MKKNLRLILIQVLMTFVVSGLCACNVTIELPEDFDSNEIYVTVDYDEEEDDSKEDSYLGDDDFEDVSENGYPDDEWNEASSEDINPETGIEDKEENELLSEEPLLSFRNDNLLNDHFEKHGIEMGFETSEEYELAAAKVVANPDALHKTEKEDGDDVYYLESTNEFVIVSTDGYLRTYFLPDKGIAYYEKQ